MSKKNTVATRPLAEVIADLGRTMQSLYVRCSQMHVDGAGQELWHACNQACVRRDSMSDHFSALDNLAHVLLKNQFYADSAVVTRCALELIAGVRAAPLDDSSILVIRAYLLAKHAHACSHTAKFSAAIKADAELGQALMAALRSDVDFPVFHGGIAALVDHLVKNTCAAPERILLTYPAEPAVA